MELILKWSLLFFEVVFYEIIEFLFYLGAKRRASYIPIDSSTTFAFSSV